MHGIFVTDTYEMVLASTRDDVSVVYRTNDVATGTVDADWNVVIEDQRGRFRTDATTFLRLLGVDTKNLHSVGHDTMRYGYPMCRKIRVAIVTHYETSLLCMHYHYVVSERCTILPCPTCRYYVCRGSRRSDNAPYSCWSFAGYMKYSFACSSSHGFRY